MYTIDLSTTGLRSNSSTPVKRHLFGRLGNERGASVLEMAFIVTIMFSLVVGAVDLGFAYQHYGVVLNSSRESARLYARLPCTGSNRTALRNALVNAAVAESAGVVGVIGGGSGIVLGQNVEITPDPTVAGCPDEGTAIEVRVSVLYESQFGELLGLGDIPISASSSMMYYGTDTSQSGS